MKILKLILLVCFPLSIFSQNVGIGTLVPSQKLEVKQPLRSTVKISSSNFDDTTELQLSNYNDFEQGTVFSLKSIREEGLFISSFSDVGPNISPRSMVIKPWGYIGINETNPAARLMISGTETDMNGANAALGLRNTSSTNTWYLRAGGTGTTTPNGGFSIADNGGYHFIIDPFGNTGIGIIPVNAKLHVNGGLRVDGNIGAGVSGPTERLEVAGTIKLTGEVNRASTTNSNLLPIAWGNITESGTVNLSSTTSNVTATSPSPGYYEITIAGESYQFQTYSAIVTPVSSMDPVFATTGSGGGLLQVYMWNLSGVKVSKQFNFIVYKE